MTALSDAHAWLTDNLPALAQRHGVPGAAAAILVDGEIADAATGVLSLATGVEATTDSLFQIGSITKIWTTSLVMQLVDEGLIELDQPLRTYLPEFVIADADAAAHITTRQLLCHRAGFEGDIFTDTGRGDDCVEKFVAGLGDVPQLFPAGEMFSYNNAGFVVLGRLVEVLRGKSFDACLKDHLIGPLGLEFTATGPYDAIRYRAAVGHLQPNPETPPTPAPVWALARSTVPAGAMLAMRPADLLAFARMHLVGGVAADGTRVLSAESVTAMQRREATLPRLGILGDAWGLGWELFDWDGGPVIGHDGGTIGQNAFLRIVPDAGVAVAMLTNGGNTLALYQELVGHLLQDLAGVTIPAPLTPPAEPERVDASRHVGTYTCDMFDMTVTQDADRRIWVDTLPKGELAAMLGDPEHTEYVYDGGETFLALKEDRGIHMPLVFVGDDGSGRSLYLHHGRAVRRAGT